MGVKVAGGNGSGVGAHQLNHQTEIFLSKIDAAIFIADSFNNRVQKGFLNSSSEITIAGSSAGLVGQTEYLMSYAYAIALNNDETLLYVSDSNSNSYTTLRIKLIHSRIFS